MLKDVQRWLMRARGLNQKIDALDELIERQRSRMEGGGSKSDGGRNRKGGGLENHIAKLETYEAERDEAAKVRDEVFEAICTLEDKRHQAALIRYYITTQGWQHIAETLGVDRRTVTRWHEFALEELKRKFFSNVPQCP